MVNKCVCGGGGGGGEREEREHTLAFAILEAKSNQPYCTVTL